MKLKNSTSRNLQYLGLALSLSCGLAGPIVVGFSQDKPPQISEHTCSDSPAGIGRVIFIGPYAAARYPLRYSQ